MKDWDAFKPFVLPVGSGKREGSLLGDRALFTLGGADGFRTRIVPLPSGGQLRVRTKGGMPEYIYEPARQGEAATPDVELKVIAKLTAALADLYMSSGAYTFGPLGGINQSDPMLTIEPVLYKSSSVEGVESSELVQHYDKTPPANGEVSKIYNHTVNPGGLNTPKVNMLNALPSKFSGLMRRYVQARYGSGRTSSDVSNNGSGIFIGSEYSRTTGLLKFGNDYVFVELSTDSATLSIKYWKVLIEEVDLVSGTEAQQILAMSSAEVDALSEKSILPISIAAGTPISYGWIFSLTTNKATVCVNEFINGYMYDRRMWRLMSLSFTYADETLSCAYNLVEEVDGTSAPTLGLIWAPAGGGTIWYNQSSTPAEPSSVQDFPVHSCYVNDVLKVVRWKWSVIANKQYSFSEFTAVRENDLVRNSMVESGTFNSKTEYFSGNVKTHGFYIQGETNVKTSATRYDKFEVTYTAAYDDPDYDTPPQNPNVGFASSSAYRLWGPGNSSVSINRKLSQTPLMFENGSNPADIHPGNHYSAYKQSNATVTGGLEVNETGASLHKSALLIPANDCANVYIGEKVEKTTSLKTHMSFNAFFYTAYTSEWYYKYIGGQYVLVGKWNPTIFRQHMYTLTNQFYLRDQTTTNYGVVNLTEISKVLYGKENISIGSADSEIFYTSQIALSKQVQVVSSGLFGDARFDGGTLTNNVVQTTSGYPIDISLFVGAA